MSDAAQSPQQCHGLAALRVDDIRALARIAELGDIQGAANDALEGDGVDDADVVVAVRATTRAGKLRLDFTGTAPVEPPIEKLVYPVSNVLRNQRWLNCRVHPK